LPQGRAGKLLPIYPINLLTSGINFKNPKTSESTSYYFTANPAEGRPDIHRGKERFLQLEKIFYDLLELSPEVQILNRGSLIK
jgi:hypothetical protein